MVTSKSAEVGDRILKVTFCFILMEEIWKDVVGYEGYYQVSNLGRVRSLDRVINKKRLKGRILLLSHDTKGYLFVILSKDNKQKITRVHRLIAEHFIPKVDGKNYIDHINGIRDDNRIDNLRWCTHIENDNFPLSRLHRSIANMGNKKWLGKHHTEETKRKLSEANRGGKSVWFGKRHTLESRIKMSKNRKGKFVKQIEQYSMNGEFIKLWDSMASVEEELGIYHSNIRNVCIGKSKHAGGFKWKYHTTKQQASV